jgi:opacity protein-like surface antigen
VTGEYRGDSTFLAQDRYPGGDGHFDFPNSSLPGGFNPGTNEYTADTQSWVGLFNGYIDLGTWHCITLYVGGGIGFAAISVNGLKDVNVPNNSVFYAQNHRDQLRLGYSTAAWPMT